MKLGKESKARKERPNLSRDVLWFNVQRTVNRNLPTTTFF
jgi:hypothetical protein